MTISQAVKRFVRLETKELYKKDNFDEVYYMLKHIIECEVEAPKIEGISEKLPDALNRIAEDGLTRQDIMLLFPVVWGTFEPYVKKILFIIDPEEFKQYTKDSNKSLLQYLSLLKIEVFVQEKYRNHFTQAFYETYRLRNTHAHECQYWSITNCYEKLSQALLAYLFLTDHCLDEIKKAIKTGNLHTVIPIYSGTRMAITCPGFINILPWIRSNPGADFRGIKKISTEKHSDYFKSDGNLEQHIFSDSDYRYLWTYEWKKEDNGELLQIEHIGEDQQIRCKCLLDDRSEVVNYVTYISVYDKEKGAKTEVPQLEWIVSHLEGGGVSLLCFRHIDQWVEVNGRLEKKATKELYERIRFNELGLILSVDRPYKDQKDIFIPKKSYEYDDNGNLTNIKIGSERSIRIETIGDEVFFWDCDEFTGDQQLTKKQTYRNKKLIESIDYLLDEKTGGSKECHTSFEYYEETNAE